MKATLGINEVIDLKKLFEQQGSVFTLHLHDACGAQSFFLEAKNATEADWDAADRLLRDYLAPLRMAPRYLNSRDTFVLTMRE